MAIPSQFGSGDEYARYMSMLGTTLCIIHIISSRPAYVLGACTIAEHQ